MNVDISELMSAWTGHKDFAIWLVNRVRPEITVDLGVDYGFSLFALAMPEIGQVYGIDSFEKDLHAGHHPDNHDVVLKFKEKHNFNNVTVIKGWFSEVAKTWDKPIDILHIDGLHTFEAITDDWNNWTPFVKDDGIVIMHDVAVFEDIRNFFNSINLPKMYFVHSAGLGIVSKNQNLLNDIANNFSNVGHGNL